MPIESRDRDRAAVAELPAEVQLVYAAAAGPRGDARVAALATGPIAWPVVAALADRERAVPALAAVLKRAAPAVWARPAVEPIRRLAMVAAFESARLESKLAALLEAYGAAGIDVVLLKGAGLALQREGTLAGRPSRDLDLLLAPEQIEPAYELARTLGWTGSPYAAADAYYEVSAHRAPLADAGGTQLQLELHDELFNVDHPFGLRGDEVRARAVRMRWRGHAVRVPCATDAILHAALHASWSHALRGAWWRSWYDVAPLLPQERAGWDALVAEAEAARAATSLYWLLRLGQAADVFDVPSDVLVTLGRRIPRLVRSRCLPLIAADGMGAPNGTPSVLLSRRLWLLAIQPRRSGHGRHTPWEHEALLGASASRPTLGERVVRHVGEWPRYAAMLRRLLLQ
jgi:hypothetical protein